VIDFFSIERIPGWGSIRGSRPAIRQKQDQINDQESTIKNHPINNESPIKDHRINNVGPCSLLSAASD